MAYKNPQPQGQQSYEVNVSDGTLCRQESPRAGVLGTPARIIHRVEVIVETTETVTGGVEAIVESLRSLALVRGFRSYSLVKHVPIPNILGDFRGIVKNQRWSKIYLWTASEDAVIGKQAARLAPMWRTLEKAEWPLLVTTSILKFKSILDPDDGEYIKDPGERYARISTQVSSLALSIAGLLEGGAAATAAVATIGVGAVPAIIILGVGAVAYAMITDGSTIYWGTSHVDQVLERLQQASQ